MYKKLIIGAIVAGMVVIAGIGVAQKFHLGKLVFTIEFNERKDLNIGDFIYLKEFKVGEVIDLKLDEKRRVILATVLLDPKRDIPDDSFCFIWSDKLVKGKKCIQIKLGDRSTFIQRNDRLRGESSFPKIIEHVGKDWLKSIDKEFGVTSTITEMVDDFTRE